MASNTTETVALFGACTSGEIHSKAATLTRPIARKTSHASNAARNMGASSERSANSAEQTALWVLRAMVHAGQRKDHGISGNAPDAQSLP